MRSFPYRHGDATGKPATRDETRGCKKTSISYETSGNFQSWHHDKKTIFAASPIDTARPRENQRRETRHVGAPKRAFRTRLPPILTLSTRYQTGWNVTKCHACHAKRHDNLLGNLRKREVLQLPMPQENQRLETRHVDAEKPAFRTRLPPIFTLCSFKIDVFLRAFVGNSKFCNLKIYVSCEDFVNFQLSPVDAALPMRFAKNTRHDTSKVLRLPRKMTMDTSKVLRLPQKTTFNMLQNTSECHKVPRVPRETKQRNVGNLQK